MQTENSESKNFENQKVITVSFFGLPNAGKSTLLNALLQKKISIVSPICQTTKTKIYGILTRAQHQIIFIDTPGIYQFKNSERQKYIQKQANGSLQECDIIGFVLSAKDGINEKNYELIEKLSKISDKKVILIINKMDLITQNELLPMIKKCNEIFQFFATFCISAKKKYGLTDLNQFFEDNSESHPWIYDEDFTTNMSQETIAREITRERLFYNVFDEIPHNISVVNENWNENKDRIIIHQTIFVKTEEHKKILVGYNAEMIKKISMQSRESITRAIGKKIHLYIQIKEDKKESVKMENI